MNSNIVPEESEFSFKNPLFALAKFPQLSERENAFTDKHTNKTMNHLNNKSTFTNFILPFDNLCYFIMAKLYKSTWDKNAFLHASVSLVHTMISINNHRNYHSGQNSLIVRSTIDLTNRRRRFHENWIRMVQNVSSIEH